MTGDVVLPTTADAWPSSSPKLISPMSDSPITELETPWPVRYVASNPACSTMRALTQSNTPAAIVQSSASISSRSRRAGFGIGLITASSPSGHRAGFSARSGTLDHCIVFELLDLLVGVAEAQQG